MLWSSTLIESDIQRGCIFVARASHCIVLRLNAGRGRHNQKLCPAGTPDLLVVPQSGGAIWVEVKQPDGVLSDVQREMHADLRERGERVEVVTSVEDMERVIGAA